MSYIYYFILPVQVKTGQAIPFFHCGQETADSLEQPALKHKHNMQYTSRRMAFGLASDVLTTDHLK